MLVLVVSVFLGIWGRAADARHTERGQAAAAPPVDAAASDPGLARVRRQILEAAARRDFNGLRPVLGPTIKFAFEDRTPEAFLALTRTWSKREVATFWQQVRDALALPMAAKDGYVFAPYVAIVDVPDYGWRVITAEHVALRTAPDLAAPVIEWLSYGQVKVAPGPSGAAAHPARIDGASYDWTQIVTPSGKTGWVVDKYARSDLGFRLLFQQIDGKWKLVAIAEGD